MKYSYIPIVFGFILLAACGSKNENHTESKSETGTEDNLLSAINEKIRAQSGNPDLYIERAKILANSGKLEAAFSDIERAIGLDSLKASYYTLKADYQLLASDIQGVQQTLERCLKNLPDSPDAHLKQAEVYMYLRKNEKAMEHVNLALKADMYNATGYFMKGIIYMEAGDTNRAVSSLQTAVEQNPDYYDAYTQLGILLAMKKNPLAKQYYYNALQLRPNSMEALYNMAMWYQGNNHFNEAIVLYNRMLKVEPGNPLANFNLGYLHLIHLHVYPEAVAYFSEAVKSRPTYYEAYYNRGYAYELMGDMLNAETSYRQSLSIRSDYTLAAEGLGRVLDRKNK